MTPFEDTMLSLLDADQRARITPHVDMASYDAGHTIVVRGELLCRLYILVRGRAEARYKTKRGPAELPLVPGDFFGEISVTAEDSVSDATVKTLERQTVVVSIAAERFRELVEANAALKHWFLERAAARRSALGAALLGLSQFTLPRA